MSMAQGAWHHPWHFQISIIGKHTPTGMLLARFAIYALTVACESDTSAPAQHWVPEDRSLCGVDITQAYVTAASDPRLRAAASP